MNQLMCESQVLDVFNVAGYKVVQNSIRRLNINGRYYNSDHAKWWYETFLRELNQPGNNLVFFGDIEIFSMKGALVAPEVFQFLCYSKVTKDVAIIADFDSNSTEFIMKKTNVMVDQVKIIETLTGGEIYIGISGWLANI